MGVMLYDTNMAAIGTESVIFYGHIAQFTSRDISLYYVGVNGLFT
jgi:hypothetical protein